MRLSSLQIEQNYRKCYELVYDILEEKSNLRGFFGRNYDIEINELCQSVVGEESVVELIMSIPYSAKSYEAIVKKAVESVKKILFLDVCKKRFRSLDASGYKIPEIYSELPKSDVQKKRLEKKDILSILIKQLSKEAMEYLEKYLFPQLESWDTYLQIYIHRILCKPEILCSKDLEKKISLFRKFYPDGNIPIKQTPDVLTSLKKDVVLDCYLMVYLGIEKRFPEYFLIREGKKRAAIMVRFLIEEILATTPAKVLKEADELFFVRHKLQNVYRFFNYSANRVLGNAYPDLIPPWWHSRTRSNYWNQKDHRDNAVRWLVEIKLGLSPQELYKQRIGKRDFNKNGLSYLINRYYNSVSRALLSAYPFLKAWEVGKVPSNFWTDNNVEDAIRWLINKKGWRLDELPQKVKLGHFNRKTFSEYGLATVFEKRFSKNIYRAVSSAYPGRFEPWEFGKVPFDYWRYAGNVFRASKWIAMKEGIPENKIIDSIRKKTLSIKLFRNYPIGYALCKISKGKIENLFYPVLWQEYINRRIEQRLLRKIKLLKSAHGFKTLLHYILYGIFLYSVQKSSLEYMKRYERIERRIRQRLV